MMSRCLKITEKVSFYNVASEASYVFILYKNSLKLPINGQFCDFLKTEVCGQTVLPDRSILIVEKCQNYNETFRVIFKQCKIGFCGIWIFAPKHKVNFFVMTSSWSQATLIVQAEQDKSNEKKLAVWLVKKFSLFVLSSTGITWHNSCFLIKAKLVLENFGLLCDAKAPLLWHSGWKSPLKSHLNSMILILSLKYVRNPKS